MNNDINFFLEIEKKIFFFCIKLIIYNIKIEYFDNIF